MSLTYDDILAATGGRVLATSPARGWDRSDGSWEIVRALSPQTRRRLVIVGMAGAERTQEAQRVIEARSRRVRVLRGSPAGPDELAWSCTEYALLPEALSSTWCAESAVDWYVAGVLAVQDDAKRLQLDDEPEPDLPAWVSEWLTRLAFGPKRSYAELAAHSLYNRGAEPVSTGAEWESKVWAKLGRRYTAEMERAS